MPPKNNSAAAPTQDEPAAAPGTVEWLTEAFDSVSDKIADLCRAMQNDRPEGYEHPQLGAILVSFAYVARRSWELKEKLAACRHDSENSEVPDGGNSPAPGDPENNPTTDAAPADPELTTDAKG